MLTTYIILDDSRSLDIPNVHKSLNYAFITPQLEIVALLCTTVLACVALFVFSAKRDDLLKLYYENLYTACERVTQYNHIIATKYRSYGDNDRFCL